MFEDDAELPPASPVEAGVCAVLERFRFVVPAVQPSGAVLDWIDVPLREASPAPGGAPTGRVWLLEEGAAHREGPQTELGRALECGVAHLEHAFSVDRQMARAAAERARALAAFARMRPAAAFDRAPGELGAASAASRAARPPALATVSEWAADEVAVKLSLSPAEATALLTQCLVLVEQLPATVEALEQGRIGWQHACVLAELLGPVSDEKRSTIEARVLARVDGKSRSQLRAAARRAILRQDAAAAVERAAAAIRERDVRLYPGEDGMASLSVTLPVPVARACLQALEQNADACAVEGDERTKAQRMVDCFTDLILRPGSNGLGPVQVQLTLVAAVNTLLGGAEPGDVDGDVVPAAVVRELAYTLGLLPRPETADERTTVDSEPGTGEPTEDGSTGNGGCAGDQSAGNEPADRKSGGGKPVEGGSAAVEPPAARERLAELLNARRTSGTALAGRPQIALVDELTGALLALTDVAGLRRGTGLGPPPESHGYHPRTELDRFVRLRDRRCRFPGCRARPRKCDLDHTCPWPAGPTSHDNLCCLCEHHHRLRHQAPGWQLWGEEDGGLTWRTPSGDTITTYPPAFGTDAHLPMADAPIAAGRGRHTAAVSTLDLLRGGAASLHTPQGDHDPPPF